MALAVKAIAVVINVTKLAMDVVDAPASVEESPEAGVVVVVSTPGGGVVVVVVVVVVVGSCLALQIPIPGVSMSSSTQSALCSHSMVFSPWVEGKRRVPTQCDPALARHLLTSLSQRRSYLGKVFGFSAAQSQLPLMQIRPLDESQYLFWSHSSPWSWAFGIFWQVPTPGGWPGTCMHDNESAHNMAFIPVGTGVLRVPIQAEPCCPTHTLLASSQTNVYETDSVRVPFGHAQRPWLISPWQISPEVGSQWMWGPQGFPCHCAFDRWKHETRTSPITSLKLILFLIIKVCLIESRNSGGWFGGLCGLVWSAKLYDVWRYFYISWNEMFQFVNLVFDDGPHSKH